MKTFKTIRIAFTFALTICSLALLAQDPTSPPITSSSTPMVKSANQSRINKSSLGIGMGMDYGGIGLNTTLYPTKNLGLFAGAGYNFAGLGFNGGLKLRLIQKDKPNVAVPYAMAMYGYNAVIAVTNKTDLNKVFHGPTFGFGLDTGPKLSKKGYWSFALTIPIRSSEVDEYIDELESSHGVEFKNKLTPVGFSIGYRLILDAK